MARGADPNAAQSLPDIEGALARAARWVGENPAVFLGAAGIVLLVAAGIGGTRWWRERAELRASGAVSEVREGFLRAMGAPPGASDFSEPANPETARRAREDYAARFAEVAEAHPGQAASVEAWIEAGNLREQLGQRDAALEAWKRGVEQAPAGSPLRALALERLASGYEARAAWAEAAAAHEEAAGAPAYPLRHFALAAAARCYAAAGERERAQALADRVASEAPDARLPDDLQARLDELRSR
jgi:tetratricopeptide (TPR) repeat protein